MKTIISQSGVKTIFNAITVDNIKPSINGKTDQAQLRQVITKEYPSTNLKNRLLIDLHVVIVGLDDVYKIRWKAGFRTSQKLPERDLRVQQHLANEFRVPSLRFDSLSREKIPTKSIRNLYHPPSTSIPIF